MVPSGTNSSGIALLIINMSVQKMLLRGWYPRGQQWYRPIDNKHVNTENVTTRMVPSGTNSSGIALLIINMSVQKMLLRGWYPRGQQWYRPIDNNHVSTENVTTRMVPSGTNSSGIALLIITMSVQKMLLRGWYPRGQQWYRPIDNKHVNTENVTTRMVPPGTNSSGIALLIINMSVQKMLLRGWYPRGLIAVVSPYW